MPTTFLLVLLAGCQTVPAPAPAAGQTRTDARGVEQVWVPAGRFLMGTAEASVLALKAMNPPKFILRELASEQPQHEVRLTAGYWIDKFEVTNRSFGVFVRDNGYRDRRHWSAGGWEWLGKQSIGQLPKSCLGDVAENPIACVTWFEAEAYAHWRGGRLPTEAEWEFAARGPGSRVYPWGSDFDASRANVVDSQGLRPVGSYPRGVSWVGAYDMAGNVMEWVQDWLAGYSEDAMENPTGPPNGKVKVEKGGWWGSPFLAARSAYRHFEDPPDYEDHHIGFRIVTPHEEDFQSDERKR